MRTTYKFEKPAQQELTDATEFFKMAVQCLDEDRDYYDHRDLVNIVEYAKDMFEWIEVRRWTWKDRLKEAATMILIGCLPWIPFWIYIARCW